MKNLMWRSRFVMASLIGAAVGWAVWVQFINKSKAIYGVECRISSMPSPYNICHHANGCNPLDLDESYCKDVVFFYAVGQGETPDHYHIYCNAPGAIAKKVPFHWYTQSADLYHDIDEGCDAIGRYICPVPSTGTACVQAHGLWIELHDVSCTEVGIPDSDTFTHEVNCVSFGRHCFEIP